MRTVTVVVLTTMLLAGAAFAQAPVIVDHDVISLRRIDFVFSVQMNRRSVEETDNSAIYPTGFPGQAIEPWSIFLDADGVTMKALLSDAMVAGGSYTLALDGVLSSAAVPSEAGYEYSFTAKDLVPPGMHSVAFLEPDAIDLVFTEDIIEAGGEDPSNYVLYETAVPSNVIGFAEVRMRGVRDRVFLRLDSALSAGTQYTMEAAGLHDPSGNPLPAVSALTFTFSGSNDRALAGLYIDDLRHNTAIDGLGFYSVDMYIWIRPTSIGFRTALFSIDYPSNIIPQDLELPPPLYVLDGDVFNGIAISSPGCMSGWTIIGRQRLTVTDHAPSIVALFSYPSTPANAASPYVLACSEGLPYSPMRISSNIEINVADARPVLVDASFSGYTVVDILFNVPMDETTAGTVSNYEVFETAAPGNTVALSSAELQSDARTVRLISSTDLMQGIDYTARISGVENAAGTAVYPRSEIVFSAVDNDPPHLLSAAMSGEHTVDLLFDEPVSEISASSMAYYDITESAQPSNGLSLYSAKLLGDGVTTRLTVGGSFVNGMDYMAEAMSVTDLRGNRMPAAETVEFTADDVYAPRLLKVSPLPGSCVRVHFDQEVDQASVEHPGNLYFYPAVNITSVTLEGSTVLIEASSLTEGSGYHFYARHIEDTEGNAMPEQGAVTFYYVPQVPAPQIGLWSDLDRNADFVQASPFQPFEFYVWCKPGPDGTYGIEYALAERSIFEFEYGIINVVNDPDVSISLGDPLSGISVCMYNCKTDWFWISKCTAFLMRGDGYLEVVPHPVMGGPNGVLCTPARPVVLMEITNMLSFQTVVGTLLQFSSAEFTGEGITVRWTLSEVDEGVEFTVLRKTGDGDFHVTPSQAILRDGLEFEYLDSEIERGISYAYRIEYLDGDVTHTLFETDAIETPALPLVLDQNRPNPFNPSTEIRFSLPHRCAVRLNVFDSAGRLIRVLHDGTLGPGRHSIVWDGTNNAGRTVGSGVYFYRLCAGKEAISKKMVLLK